MNARLWRNCVIAAVGMVLASVMDGAQQAGPRTGPETEKRFPPLKTSPGFLATLFACDPLIEYPSAIALGPRPGSIFVAVDYLTGLGTDITRRDEIRLVEDTDGDGYADKATVYADQFNSIQGLTYHAGFVYAMHAPLLTALRDQDGDGKADDRRDLVVGLGLPPEKNPVRLHCANGVVMGHDGWLYLALGDNGCDVERPEGDRLVLNGGGILRCRGDGRDLHVLASGLRNIYDVALDAESNVFVRDNENDGGDYKIRVCHSFFGADHGYPYLYYERAEEALPPLADLGLGSSAGGLSYLETQFPAEHHGNLFFCEWGRSVVRYHPQRSGASFAPLKEHVFASGAPKDPYGFKPTDLVVERDGSLIVADWADDQRPKRGRGRIYRIRHVGANANTGGNDRLPQGPGDRAVWLAKLNSESYYERVQAQESLQGEGDQGVHGLLEALAKQHLNVRGRLHAVWILARPGDPTARQRLFDLAKADPDPRVRAQAVRALADLTDPVLQRHRLDAGRGDDEIASRLVVLVEAQDPSVVLEVVVALGRLRWADAPAWLSKHVTRPDAALSHAAMQTLRRADNWPGVLRLLDVQGDESIRAIALRAVGNQVVSEVVDGLIDRLHVERDSGRRREYADALTRVYKKPGPWVYWGYRPPPRPANAVAWERTEAIAQALDRLLADPEPAVRLSVLRRMQREKVPTNLATLGRWLQGETTPERIGAILDSLREHPAGSIRVHLEPVVTSRPLPSPSRLAALVLLTAGLDEASEKGLLTLAGSLEDGTVLAEVLRHLGKRPRIKAAPLLLDKLRSTEPVVRATALEALVELGSSTAGQQPPEDTVLRLLQDRDARVRQAAALAAGKFNVRSAGTPLLSLARDGDAAVRTASLESLRLLKEPRALPLAIASLTDPMTSVTALECIAELGGPEHAEIVAGHARRQPSADVIALTVRTLTRWSRQDVSKQSELDRTVAELQASSAVLARWSVAGPLAAPEAAQLAERLTPGSRGVDLRPGEEAKWQTVFGSGVHASVRLKELKPNAVWLAWTDLDLPESTMVQFLAGSSASLRVWLNRRPVYQRDQERAFQVESDRFEATLEKGANRLCLQIGLAKTAPEFHVRFRRKSTRAEHENLMQAALSRPGNVERGRTVFLDAQKAQCVKCHRLGDLGERIGPELTGIGSRFARVHLIESILDPSRTVTLGYQTEVVLLKDGRTLTGVKIAEADDSLTLADQQGLKHVLARADIDQQRASPVSTMPEGLEKELTVDEFVDLIAFLASQQAKRSP